MAQQAHSFLPSRFRNTTSWCRVGKLLEECAGLLNSKRSLFRYGHG